MGSVKPVLSLSNLRVAFRGVRVLDLKGLDVLEGPVPIHFFLGPNGAGKTTLLNAVTGYVEAEAGSRVQFLGPKGYRLDRLSRPGIIRAGVARTFQSPPVFSSLTLREGVALAELFTGRGGWLRAACRPLSRPGYTAVDAIISALGISHHADRSLGGLSLSLLRRAEIGRCLATQPRILFLDEPTAGVDHAERAFLARFLLEDLPLLVTRLYTQGCYRHDHLTVCVITHDLTLVRETADRAGHEPPTVHVLDQGRLLASGPAEGVLGDRDVRRIYLGVA